MFQVTITVLITTGEIHTCDIDIAGRLSVGSNGNRILHRYALIFSEFICAGNTYRGSIFELDLLDLALVRSEVELYATHALEESWRDSVVIEGKLK
ncbi:hypothetical protein GGP89_003619, partial [Salinibacter ruber]